VKAQRFCRTWFSEEETRRHRQGKSAPPYGGRKGALSKFEGALFLRENTSTLSHQALLDCVNDVGGTGNFSLLQEQLSGTLPGGAWSLLGSVPVSELWLRKFQG